MNDAIGREDWRSALREDCRLQSDFDELGRLLLGPDLARSLRVPGARLAHGIPEEEVLDLIEGVHPSLAATNERDATKLEDGLLLRQFFVVGLYRAARERVDLQAAIREGFAVSARSLALQLALHSKNPMEWARILKGLREGRKSKAVAGSFPGMGADGFNLALVTVLTDEIRLEFERSVEEEAALAPPIGGDVISGRFPVGRG